MCFEVALSSVLKRRYSLSSNGWSCVPTLLVVWLEAFQPWSMHVDGWGCFGAEM